MGEKGRGSREVAPGSRGAFTVAKGVEEWIWEEEEGPCGRMKQQRQRERRMCEMRGWGSWSAATAVEAEKPGGRECQPVS